MRKSKVTEYPEGAIKTKAELVLGERLYFSRWFSGGGIEKARLLAVKGEFLLLERIENGAIINFRHSAPNWSMDNRISPGAPRFVFTNYWLAYGWQLRADKIKGR